MTTARRLLAVAGAGAHARQPVWTKGTISAVAGQQTVIDDATWNEFPGIVRLDPDRVLAVYDGNGTAHTVGHQVCGQIGYLNSTRDGITSWDSRFTIVDDAEDVRCEDAVSLVDGQIVVAYRLFDGSDNHSPAITVCNSTPATFTATASWSTPTAVPLTTGSANNKSDGHVVKTADGGYYLPVEYDNSNSDRYVGIWRWTGSVTNAAAGSFTLIGHAGKVYSELAVQPIGSTGTLLALLRNDTDSTTRQATSTDYGATWGSISNAHDGHGHPTFRRLTSGILLTIYRDSPNGHNMFRYSTDSGATWSAETTFISTGTRDAYDTMLQVTDSNILALSGVEYSGDGSTGTADIFAKWLTDSSTYA